MHLDLMLFILPHRTAPISTGLPRIYIRIQIQNAGSLCSDQPPTRHPDSPTRCISSNSDRRGATHPTGVGGSAHSEASTLDRHESRVAPSAAPRRPRELVNRGSTDKRSDVCRWSRALLRAGQPLRILSLARTPRWEPS